MQSSSVLQSTDKATAQSVRLHYLDWLRVLAILGVFLYHAVHPFDPFKWHIKNAESSEVIGIGIAFVFSWGLPLFFLISGAGSWFALRRRTVRQSLRERFNRLFIPFVVGSILLTPIQIYLEWVNRTQTGVTQASFQEYLSMSWVGVNPRLKRNLKKK